MFNHFSNILRTSRRAGGRGWARGVPVSGHDVLASVRSASGAPRLTAFNGIARRHSLFVPVVSRLPSLAPVKSVMRVTATNYILRCAASPLVMAKMLHPHPRNAGQGQMAVRRAPFAGGWNFTGTVANYIPVPHAMSAARKRVFSVMPPALAGLAATGTAPSAARGRSFAPPVIAARATQSRDGRAVISPVWRDHVAEAAVAAFRSPVPGSESARGNRARPMPMAGEVDALATDIAAQAPPTQFDIGPALEAYFFRQSRLPPSGAAAFDPRISPAWTGLGLV